MEKLLSENEDPDVSGLRTLIGFRPLISSALSFYCIFKKSPLKVFWILVQMFLSYLKNIGLMNGLYLKNIDLMNGLSRLQFLLCKALGNHITQNRVQPF